MAENLRHWGIETRLMEQQAQVMPGVLEADMAGLVAEALGLWRQGLPVRRGRGV